MDIILSNKAKRHMEAHKGDFLVPYNDLIEWSKANGEFNGIYQRFEKLVVEFPYYVGYGKLHETSQYDEIVYAQRIGRDIYTRFVKNKEAYLTNKCLILLSKNLKRNNEYYLITIFPGYKSVKEPEDKSIKTSKELRESLEFWEKHALVYEPDVIKQETETSICPYAHLYNRVYK